MSQYGSGISLSQAFNLDKERIKAALDGRLVCGEDEKGFVYSEASKEECEAFILSCFDNAVCHALDAYRSGKAMEMVVESLGLIDIDDPKFFMACMEQSQKLAKELDECDDRYIYEGEGSDE